MSVPVHRSDSELLTLSKVSDLGFGTVAVLRDMIRSGELAALKVRGVYRVRRCDLDAFVAAHRSPAAADTFDDFVESVVAAAPSFSDDQRARLASVLAGGGAA